MNFQLNTKTAFITGSTAGIGFAVAQAFLKESTKVIINGRSKKSVDNAIHKLKKEFPTGNIDGISCDFSNLQEIESLLLKLPQIDILINNVGVYTSLSFFDTTDTEWNRQLEINLLSGVRLSRVLLPKMKSANWGRIIFISSECASLIPEDLIAYSTTKAAIQALSRGLAQLTKGTNVTVNTISPGSTLTEGAQAFLSNLAREKEQTIDQVSSDFFKKVRTSSIIQRFASVEEIANTIVYFSSPLAAATNGAVIKIDGGSIGGIF